MFSFRRWALALLVLAAPFGLRASAETDAMNALDAANAQVNGLSAIKSPSASNFDAVQGELKNLGPFFSTVATRLQGIPIDGSSQLLELGGSISAKINTAGQTSSVNIGVLIQTLQGLSIDLGAWQALLPTIRSELQQRVDQQTQQLIRDEVNKTFPSPTPLPQAPVPTATAIVWPTPVATLPPLASTPTPVTLPPVNGGGVIPGPPPTPVPQPTAMPGVPTPVPTPRAVLKLPVPVAAGHNDQTVWSGNVQAGTVSVFDTSAKRFIAVIPVGSAPASLALDDSDNTLVVANSGSNNVSIIDARAGTVTKTIGVGAQPLQALVTHGGKAYILCQAGQRIDVIDLKRNLLVKSISLGSRPGHMDWANSQQSLYVTLPDVDSLAVIDTGIDDVVATVAE
jgi:YVTN family beta-propeller protein